MTGRIAFLSWFRKGLSTAISGAPSGGRAEIKIELSFNKNKHKAGVTLPLQGPGDITGIKRTGIVRAWPEAGTGDAEPTCFPVAEFAEPDLPWRYTPTMPASNRLAPWLCLLVLREGGETPEIDTHLPSPGKGMPPGIRINAGAAMPDLEQAWAWAHVQVTLDGSSDSVEAQVRKAADTEPERAIARLICGRRLEPNTNYTAVIAPTFEQGRLAGLGRTITAATSAIKPAWKLTSGKLDSALALPVYHYWSFNTGPAGDFESLARRLRVRSVPPWMGFRAVDGSRPGPSPLASAGKYLMVPGALQSLEEAESESKSAAEDEKKHQAAFAAGVAARITAATAPASPSVAPPLYGRWPAARSALETDKNHSVASGRPWLDEINCDAAMRLVAGEGMRVVQSLERELMGEAWAQAGDVERANEELRRTELAVSAASTLHQRHMLAADDEHVMQLAGLLADRIVDASGDSIEKHLADAQAPAGLLDPALRRILRRAGAMGRARSASTPPVKGPASGSIRVSPPPRLQGGMLTLQRFALFLDPKPPSRFAIIASRIEVDSVTSPTPDDGAVERILKPLNPNDPNWNRDTPREWYLTFEKLLRAPAPPKGARLAPARIPPLAAVVRKQLDPCETIPRHYRYRLNAPPASRPGKDPLDPVIVVPRIARPMVEPLIERSMDWLLPGLSDAPPESLSLVRTNRRFIESYMAGLNHEMARELLWNGYPSDPAGTVFHRFWNNSGHLKREHDTSSGTWKWREPDWRSFCDISDLHTWKGMLGSHRPAGGQHESIVLLVRGALLQRYPRTHVVAIGSRIVDGKVVMDNQQQRLPIFTGRAEPDVAFFGFDLKVEEALGSPGWFIALVEPATETQFGLDVTGKDAWPDKSNDLAFSHFQKTEPGNWLDLNKAHKRDDDAINGAWLHPDRGATSAIVAEFTSANLVRVVFHAGELFKGKVKE